MPKYKVLSPIALTDSQTLKTGDTVELSEDEAAKMPWAVELVVEEKKAAPKKDEPKAPPAPAKP